MRLNILSDLHGISLFYNRKQLSQFAAPQFSLDQLEYSDVLVIAGDIGNTGLHTQPIIGDILKYKNIKFNDLVFVYGNHDFYYYNIKNIFSHELVTKQIIGDVVFLKLTMWSPIFCNKEIEKFVTDYHLIGEYTIKDNNELFISSMKKLIFELNNLKNTNKKIVVVSHHVPAKELISDEHKDSNLNEAFVVMHPFLEYDSIPDMISKIGCHNLKLWIHGHSHSFMDKTINGVRYIRNPVGYQNEMSDFKNNFIVEI